MEKLKSIPRSGEAVESICMIMALLSLVGGVICAFQFGEKYEIGYAGGLRAKTSPALVVAWLAGGMSAAVFWWILGRIGTALRWLEAMADATYGPEISEKPFSEIPEPNDAAVEDADLSPPPKPKLEVKSPEQLAKEEKDSRNSMLIAGAVILVVAVIFYFFIGY